MHWRRADTAALPREVVPAAVAGEPCLAVDAADLLVGLTAQLAAAGAEPRDRYLGDVVQLLADRRVRVDWERVAGAAVALRVARAVVAATGYAEDLLGPCVPDDARAALVDAAGPRRGPRSNSRRPVHPQPPGG